MSIRPTITLGVCLAAGLAFGIALARPGSSTPTVDAATGSTIQAAADSPYGGGQQDADQAAGGDTAAPASVTIADFDFGQPLTVGPGATVAVTNADGASHTLTADDGSFDTGSIATGAVATIQAPSAPGTYQIFCSIHPSMQGTLTVQG